jgi:hypothetical protein
MEASLRPPDEAANGEEREPQKRQPGPAVGEASAISQVGEDVPDHNDRDYHR